MNGSLGDLDQIQIHYSKPLNVSKHDMSDLGKMYSLVDHMSMVDQNHVT